METIKLASILILIILISGCVQTRFEKSISVTKDAQGNIIQTVETETVSQPGNGIPIKLEKIKNIQFDGQPSPGK